MESLLPNFYNNLLGIEITTLGIIAAATFVFLQMLHSSFSFKEIIFSLKKISVFIYIYLSIIVTFTAGLGSLHFAIGAHDFIPLLNFYSSGLFDSDYTAALLLLCFLISAIVGIANIIESFRLLDPYFLMRKHLDAANAETIKRFLHKRYGVPSPIPIPISIILIDPDQKQTAEEEVEAKNKAEAKFAADSANYERLKSEAEGAEDVFEGFENLIVKAVAGGDISTCRRAIKNWSEKLQELFATADELFPTRYLANYAGEALVTFLEACKKHSNQTLPREFISATQNVALFLMRHKHQHDAIEILQVWKEQADISINESNRRLFKEIVHGLKEIADEAFMLQMNAPDDRHDILDESFRNMGWLAERLLTKKGIEEKPLMWDSSYDDEFDAIYNTLFHFEFKYNFENPSGKPLIFFDAIRVLFNRLLKIYMSPKVVARRENAGGGDLKNWVWSCASVYASFGSDALKVSNGDGVSLAALQLKDVYNAAVEAGADDIARDILELIVRLAIQVAGYPGELKCDTFLGEPIQDTLDELILSSKYKGTIESAVFNNFIRAGDGGDHEAKYEYVKSLGVRLGTNFRLMFDETTGLNYAGNDPRRR